jgi:hypothetical protein
MLAVSPAFVKVALPVTSPESETVTALDKPPAVPVVFWFSVATRAAATVPVLMFDPFKAVQLAPLPLNAAEVNKPVLGL